MGLDGVELVMAVEEAFDIHLEDDEAAKVMTPGDLIALVLTKVKLADSTTCLTQRQFNLLRRSLLRRLPVKRKDITPRTPMATLVPRADRPRFMTSLAEELRSGTFPALVRPPRLVNALLVACLALGVGDAVGLTYAVRSFSWSTAAWCGGITAVVAGLVAHAATRSQCLEFPALIATVGGLARFVTAYRVETGEKEPLSWPREQVAERVRAIVIEQLDCADAYREDASFVQDLGMD